MQTLNPNPRLAQRRDEAPGRRAQAEPGAHVGPLSGGKNNMNVPASRRVADISQHVEIGGPLSPGERPRADDRR
jgi:hypothetical protein